MGSAWILTDERYLRQRMPLALLRWLRSHGLPARLVVADEHVLGFGHGHTGPWIGVAEGDVVVGRTRHPFALALLRAAAATGAAVLTPWERIAAVRNKPRATQLIARHAIPAPPTFLAADPAALRRLSADCFPLVLKPHLGDNAQGIIVVRDVSELDDVGWNDEMVLAQRFVDARGVDLKLYAVGDRLWAIRRASPLAPDSLDGAQRVEVTPTLVQLVASCRRAFGLDLLGVDVLESAEGPVVVDVNDFPNYTGIDEAPGAIGALVSARLTTESRT